MTKGLNFIWVNVLRKIAEHACVYVGPSPTQRVDQAAVTGNRGQLLDTIWEPVIQMTSK